MWMVPSSDPENSCCVEGSENLREVMGLPLPLRVNTGSGGPGSDAILSKFLQQYWL